MNRLEKVGTATFLPGLPTLNLTDPIRSVPLNIVFKQFFIGFKSRKTVMDAARQELPYTFKGEARVLIG